MENVFPFETKDITDLNLYNHFKKEYLFLTVKSPKSL